MKSESKPNVIIVITDDQGYGDLGCTGNPYIKTPNIDGFYKDSVKLSDFHVEPLCAPTRGALMTGRRPLRNGVWATCWGRSILKKDEITIADVFKANGYKTGMFGKWHLGDNYPYRPMDRGFSHVVAHKGGGVGQTPDFWGNNYFDDTYFHNGIPVSHDGYCTDVWFEEAIKFIKNNKDEPFLAYISTNAPHSPYLVADKYSDMYRNNPDIPCPEFYGMISNIDENFGNLLETLDKLKLRDNTIIIFMTDNGSSGCGIQDKNNFVVKGYNAGMRGMKGSYYDGGHRVPFFIQWKNGGLLNKEIDKMCLGIDLFPTLIDLCKLKYEPIEFDGLNIASMLKNEEYYPNDRAEFIQYHQGTEIPEKWDNAVISNRWRLIRGKELYDIKKDPGQRFDVSKKFPEIVALLRDEHEFWWNSLFEIMTAYSPIYLGDENENPTRLDAMDVQGDVAWNQEMVAAAVKSAGKWEVFVTAPGIYEFVLRRWPKELNLPISASVTENQFNKLAPYMKNLKAQALDARSAKLKIFEKEYQTELTGNQEEACFTVTLDKAGQTVLEASFSDSQDLITGAYYVYVTKL